MSQGGGILGPVTRPQRPAPGGTPLRWAGPARRCPVCREPADGSPGAPCARCRRALVPAGPVRVAGAVTAVAVVEHTGRGRDVVLSLRLRDRRRLVGWMGRRLAEAVHRSGFRPDLVVWVPPAPLRPDGPGPRGFAGLLGRAVAGPRPTRTLSDPAELLARATGRALGVEVRGVLARSGPPQHGRGAEARRRGPTVWPRRPVTGRDVLVVDDVVTTGASLAAAVAALRAGGARSVSAAAFSRRPPPR